MKALVEQRIEDAEMCWRALRGTMQCVLQTGYEHGWNHESSTTGPSSPNKFVRDTRSNAVKTLNDAQKEPSAYAELSQLKFSPNCRFVAEYGNSASGGKASFTFDEYKVRVFDTTTGICVYENARKEVQGWCSPYKHSGGTIESVVWWGPNLLKVTWSDGHVDAQEFDMRVKVSAFHFRPCTWQVKA